MTECQGCGAWNERHRTLCVLCATPLAETDEWDAAAELPPLPPLPDGGLSATMPAWLRAVPETPVPDQPDEPAMPVILATEEEITFDPLSLGDPPREIAVVGAVVDPREPAPADAMPAEPPLGPQADPRTFLRDDDFPRWIRDLPALPPRPVPPVAVIAPPAELAAVAPRPDDPAPPLLPQHAPTPVSQGPLPQGLLPAEEAGASFPGPQSSAEIPATPTESTAHRREAWETPLLVVLVVGVVAAVIWALLVNGMIGGGL